MADTPGIGLWTEHHEEPVPVEVKRGLVPPESDELRLTREQAERQERQQEFEEREQEKAAALERVQAEMADRVKGLVDPVQIQLQVGAMRVGIIVPVNLDEVRRQRIMTALTSALAASLEWQRAAVAAASYPTIKPFAYEKAQWEGETGRLIRALHDEGLVEVFA